jgi:O-antigen ligase
MLVAVLTGLVVPFLFFGRAVMAVPLLAAVLIVALWLPGRGNYWRQMIERARTPMGLLFLITLVFLLPGIFYSPFPFRSFEAWVRIPVFVGSVTLLWAMLSEDYETLLLSLKVLFIASAIAILLALASLSFAPEVLYFVKNKWYPIRVTEELKGFSSVAILLAPVLLWAGRRLGGRWRLSSVLAVVGILGVVWLTRNKAAMAGLLLMLVVGGGLMMAVRRNKVVNIVVCVALAAVTLAIVLWLHEIRGHLQPPEGAVTVLPPWLIDWQRQTIWANTINLAMKSPWFGNGINVINLLPGAEVRLGTSNLNVIPAHPHNWLFEVFAETGAVGVFGLLTLVIALCMKLAGDYLKYDDTALFAALMVAIGYWGSGLLNFSFWSAWWQASYLLLTAFCLAGRKPQQKF